QSSRTQVTTRNPLQWLLVGVQVALAVTLLAGAGLLLRSFQELGRVSPGFDASHVLTFHISASYAETADWKGLTQRIDRTIDSPDSLKSINVMVNRSFANTYLGESTALGRHLQEVPISGLLPPGEIRGIVGDAREEGLNREPGPTVYWCTSASGPDPFYLIRTRTEPMAMAETVRQKIHEIEPARSVFNIAPLTDHLDEAFAENRLRTVLLAFFAATAVSLACVGLYGTLSYSVNVRRREVGLRLALGAL